MRSARPGSSPAALWIALARHVPAGASSHVAKPQQEGIHQLDKPHAQAPVAGRHPRRRERSICPSTYALCPESAGGGCCPPLYACATDSCYATTAGATSACGREGYYACGADVSGGCCPQGYLCGPSDCVPPAGLPNTWTSCPASYHLCPASLDYGCCPDGYGCAARLCYATALSTWTVTRAVTTTTTSGARVVTTTQEAITVLTPTVPTALPTRSDPRAVAKFTPARVGKVAASAAPSDRHGGLTRAQLGGLIGGAGLLLLVVLVVAVVVLRRLNRVARAVERRHWTLHTGPDRPQKPGGKLPPSRDADGTSGEHQVTPSEDDTRATRTQHRRGTRRRTDSGRSTSQRAAPTPVVYGSPTPSESGGGRSLHAPERVHNVPGHHRALSATYPPRESVDSRAAAVHNRNGSHSTSQTAGTGASSLLGSPLSPAELDADGGLLAELPSPASFWRHRPLRRSGSSTSTSSSGVFGSSRPPLVRAGRRMTLEGAAFARERRASSGGSSSVGGVAAAAAGDQGPGETPPAPGDRGAPGMRHRTPPPDARHGFFGPHDRQAGQTAVGLPTKEGPDPASPCEPYGFESSAARGRHFSGGEGAEDAG